MLFFLFIFFSLNVNGYFPKYSNFVDALYYEKMGEYSKSYDIVNSIIKDGEKDPFLYKYLYNLSLRAGDYEKSEEIMKEIVNVEPQSSNNWVMYGNILAQKGKTDEAKKAYLKAIELDKENIDAYYQMAVLVSSNAEESIKYFNKIIEIDASYKADVYYNIAVIYSMNKNEKKMIDYLNMAIKEDPSSLKPYYFLALYYEDKKNIPKAIETYKKILEIEPNNIEVVNKLIQIYITNKEYDKSEELLKNFLNYEPKNKRALWYLALLSENRNDFKSAKNYIAQIDNWSDDIDMVLKMSYYNIMLSDIKGTIDILENAHNKWRDNLAISYYLALGYMDMGRDIEAKKLFEIVLSSQVDNYDARYNLGVVCERLNDVKCFVDNFGYILQKNPSDHSVLNYLGYSLIDRDLYLSTPVVIGTQSLMSSLDMVKRAVELDRENIAYLDSLAWGYYKIGEFEKARQIMDDVIERMENDASGSIQKDPLLYEHYADILVKNNDLSKAYMNYKTSLIYGSKRIDIIKSKAKKIILGLSKDFLLNQLMASFKGKMSFDFSSKINLSYKKFIFTKKLSYTSMGVSKIDFYKDYFSFLILDPLFTPLLTFQSDDEKYYFEFKPEIEGINKNFFENYAVSFLLNLKNYFTFREKYYSDELKYQFENGCFVFTNLIKKNDKVYFCIKDEPFAFSQIIYKSDIEFSINFDDFKMYTNGYDRYYLPQRISFDIDGIGKYKLSFTIDVENYEIK
jgi:tetratricopeptide (TPR) repeat protein